jgi:hypothetical protein
VIGDIGSQQKMQKFGGEVLDLIESGKELTGDDLLSLGHKYKLSKEETEQVFTLLQKSKALDAAIRKRKLAETPFSDVIQKGPAGALDVTPGSTLEQVMAAGQAAKPLISGMFPEQPET